MLKKIIALLIAIGIYYSVHSGITSAEVIDPFPVQDAIPFHFDSSDEISEANQNDTLKNKEDAKYYSFDMAQNGEVFFIMQQNPNVEIGITLYDPNGKKYETYYTNKGNLKQELFGQGLSKGTYYVKVFIHNATGSFSTFELNMTRTYGDNSELENNDTFDSATPIKLNQSYFGYTDQENKADFYQITTLNDGVIHLKGIYSGKSTLSVRLSNDEGELIGYRQIHANGVSKNTSFLTQAIKRGTYYIAFSSEKNEPNVNEDYEFRTLFIDNIFYEKESNDLIKQANPLIINSTNYGLISHKKDKDVYKFYTSNSKSFSLSFSKLEATRLKVRVVNSKGRVIKTYETKKGNDTLDKLGDFKLAKGTYYLLVEYLQGESENVFYYFSLK